MRKRWIKLAALGAAAALGLVLAVAMKLGADPRAPVSQFFAYDTQVPLDPEITPVSENEAYTLSHVVFSSVHRARVPALLYIPKLPGKKLPAILYQHGAGDSKQGDYIQKGLDLFARSGFVAMAIDAEFHGERAVEGYDMDAETLLDVPPVELRNAMVQSIVDLRRATDFLSSQEAVDPSRIGYIGVSMGGIMGATFAGLDQRIKVCILAVAGGGFGSMARFSKMTPEMREMARILEPLNYVARISPRRLHMINAEKDEIIPRVSTNLLYARARQPKSIHWYPSGHVLPADEALAEARDVFLKDL